jgi:dolichol kinase
MNSAEALKPPDVASCTATSNASLLSATEDADELRNFSRTPRPYHHDPLEAWEGRKYARHEPEASTHDVGGGEEEEERRAKLGNWPEQSGHASLASSESGTEADDERPTFIKALPPSTLRPRKGLKTGEQDEDALLTPSQLDEKEKQLSSYFQHKAVPEHGVGSADIENDEHQRLFKRRYAEFARRSWEVALMAGIMVCVLCGRGVATTAWRWRRELLSQVLTIAALILVYPVKLSMVDTAATRTSVWQRFRVPASFDPATILYPPLLPIMVALSVAPGNEVVILPNIILGLAALPQRLFPRSSRLGRFNSVHWLVAVIPLIISENTAWPWASSTPRPHLLDTTTPALSPETLVTLYPLHHALLQPLQYLTTTSLLISELHLLSAVLINLLLLASSPQTVILKACLWTGGVLLFLSCGPFLQWNVTLARIPRWKLRRPGHTAEERKSLVDAVSGLVNLQRATSAFKPTRFVGSDADEDEPSRLARPMPTGRCRGNTERTLMPPSKRHSVVPERSCDEPQSADDSSLPQTAHVRRPRRNTLPPRSPADMTRRRSSTKRSRVRSSHLSWYLHLTPDQARNRKWLYAGFVYLAVLFIILLPVRVYVSRKALHGREPIGWAIGYLFGQIPQLQHLIARAGLDSWIPFPPGTRTVWPGSAPRFPLHFDLLRYDVGPANVRLLLIAYWVAVLMLGLLAVFSLQAVVEVDTRRKVFHGTVVAMFLPTIFVDPCFCSLAMALVLAVFLLLEIIRAGQVPPLGNAIGRFVAPYVDGRDLRGPVVVSHIFLLIGCAVPLWFSLASMPRAGDSSWGDWELADGRRETAMIAGVVCVGMGDAAASLIGRRYGRRKWIWVGGKSLEGSAAFAAAVTLGLLAARAWQVGGGWNDEYVGSGHRAADWSHWTWEWAMVSLKAGFCACGASFMEAVLTGANDNVVVPVALWLLVRGVRL